MKYIEIRLNVKANNVSLVTDVIAALLAEAGYDSFVPDATGVCAYIPENKYSEPALQQIIDNLPIDAKVDWTCKHFADQNWNEEWEKHYFQPIVVDNECVIHSTFHTDIPDVRYKIVIDPKMAFGTGHHETTSLMLEWILRHDFEGEHVLDMGCGTAILAILARMRNAKHVTAIDIDEWAYENAKENIRLNETDRIEVLLGDKQLLHTGLSFDTVLANINRNILLNDMKQYVACMHTNSELYMSGFYVDDIAAIREEAEKNGLAFIHYKEKNRWAEVKFIYKG